MSRSRYAMYSEKYYDLDEEEMQDLVNRSQRGDSSAQMELLEVFSNFLNKYVAMLYNCRYSLDDYDVRKFLTLFVPDASMRKGLKKKPIPQKVSKYILEVAQGIQYMVRRYGDEEDVRQTVNLTFFQCVDRYERRGEVPFSGYLYSYFFYLMKKNVELLLIDQLGRRTFPLLSDDESNSDEWEPFEKTQGFTAPPEPSAEEFLHALIIDERWVFGETAYPPFDTLTTQERQLLKWRYVNEEKASAIARRTTEHPNTVREHLGKIRDKLDQALREEIW